MGRRDGAHILIGRSRLPSLTGVRVPTYPCPRFQPEQGKLVRRHHAFFAVTSMLGCRRVLVWCAASLRGGVLACRAAWQWVLLSRSYDWGSCWAPRNGSQSRLGAGSGPGGQRALKSASGSCSVSAPGPRHACENGDAASPVSPWGGEGCGHAVPKAVDRST
eukprot:4035674-Prymnesium_polylepis.1